MTEFSIHHGVPQTQPYLCRLLRKAYASRAEVAVLGQERELDNLSRQLWCVGELDFIAHASLHASQIERKYARIHFIDDLSKVTHQQLVINLLSQVPSGFERFDRVIEVVGQAEEERASARSRLRYYKERGYAIQYHPYAAKSTE